MSMPGAVQKDRGQPALVRIGTIETVNPVSVRIQETVIDSSRVGTLGWYIPTLNDTVAVIAQSAVGTSGSSWLILGNVTGADLANRIAAVRVVTASQGTLNAALGSIPWASAEYDTHGFWNAGTPTQVVIPFDGVFAVTFEGVWAITAGGGVRYLANVRNGVNMVQHRHLAVVNDFNEVSLGSEYECAAGDVLEFQVYQTSGGLLNINDVSATVRYVGSVS